MSLQVLNKMCNFASRLKGKRVKGKRVKGINQ